MAVTILALCWEWCDELWHPISLPGSTVGSGPHPVTARGRGIKGLVILAQLGTILKGHSNSRAPHGSARWIPGPHPSSTSPSAYTSLPPLFSMGIDPKSASETCPGMLKFIPESLLPEEPDLWQGIRQVSSLVLWITHWSKELKPEDDPVAP